MAGEAKLRWQRSRNGLADPDDFERARAKTLRETLEHLGPLYIKVGQMLSTRPDLVSQTVIDALQDLHEQVMVRPFAEFEPVLEKNLGFHWRSRATGNRTRRSLRGGGTRPVPPRGQARRPGGRPQGPPARRAP